MNPANAATSVRILLIPFFILSIIRGHNVLALGLFFLAGVTDFLDGFFARTYGIRTKLGSYLDPAADKLLVSSSLIALTILGDIPLWLSILVFSRDLIISVGTGIVVLLRGAVEIKPTLSGKTATVLQLALILVVLVSRQPLSGYGALAEAPAVAKAIVFDLSAVTAFFTVLSGSQYLYRGSLEIVGRKR